MRLVVHRYLLLLKAASPQHVTVGGTARVFPVCNKAAVLLAALVSARAVFVVANRSCFALYFEGQYRSGRKCKNRAKLVEIITMVLMFRPH